MMKVKNDIERQITIKQRRLQKLKEQAALHGTATEPGILIEIEDLEIEIRGLQEELASSSSVSAKVDVRPKGKVYNKSGQQLLVSLLLVVGVGVVIFGLFWLFYKNPISPPATVVITSDFYDDFDDQKYDGSLDQIRWHPFGEEFGQIYQQHGNLVVSHEVSAYDDKIGLDARPYQRYVFNVPTFFETSLLLEDPQQSLSTQQSHMAMGLFSDSALEETALCGLEQSDEQLQFICLFYADSTSETMFETGYGRAEYNQWYTFRIEVYPTTMAFSYYINDQIVGTYKPQNVEELRNANYEFSLGINGFHSGTLTGRIDNVKIGEIGQ